MSGYDDERELMETLLGDDYNDDDDEDNFMRTMDDMEEAEEAYLNEMAARFASQVVDHNNPTEQELALIEPQLNIGEDLFDVKEALSDRT